MKTPLPIVAAAAVLAMGGAWCQDADPAAAELAALEKSAVAFVEAYNKADAPAIAALFATDGEIVLASGAVIGGRAAIEAHYTEVFADDQETKAALEAGSVRFVTPGVAIEDGTFHLTEASGAVSSIDYSAVLVKQEDGSWRFGSVRDVAGDRAPPAEKLAGLGWLVGDWIAEVKGTDTRLSFRWSDDGPYLDGKATTEAPGAGSTAATWRIGWDTRRQDFVSWGFDNGGGYNFAEWTSIADGSWLLHTRGITADGENNRLTQVITVGAGGENFTVTRRDHVIDDELQPERIVTFVKQPPEPKAAAVNPQ